MQLNKTNAAENFNISWLNYIKTMAVQEILQVNINCVAAFRIFLEQYKKEAPEKSFIIQQLNHTDFEIKRLR